MANPRDEDADDWFGPYEWELLNEQAGRGAGPEAFPLAQHWGPRRAGPQQGLPPAVLPNRFIRPSRTGTA
jgi:hypothetical protein